jgi:hypothetical protein
MQPPCRAGGLARGLRTMESSAFPGEDDDDGSADATTTVG